MSVSVGKLWANCGHGTRINGVQNDRHHGIASAQAICPRSQGSMARDFSRALRTTLNGFTPVSKLWPKCGHVRDRSARVQGPMRPTVPHQSTPCRFRFTLSLTRTISAKHAEVHQNLSRKPSPHGTATRRWPVKCRRGHHGVQTRGAGAANHGIEDERDARLRAH